MNPNDNARRLHLEIKARVLTLQKRRADPTVWVNPDDWQAMVRDADEHSVGPPLKGGPSMPPGSAAAVGMINGAVAYLDASLKRGAYRVEAQ